MIGNSVNSIPLHYVKDRDVWYSPYTDMYVSRRAFTFGLNSTSEYLIHMIGLDQMPDQEAVCWKLATIPDIERVLFSWGTE